jgi:hypothetical protein
MAARFSGRGDDLADLINRYVGMLRGVLGNLFLNSLPTLSWTDSEILKSTFG